MDWNIKPDYQLYWRGALNIKDPLNPHVFRKIEQVELSYAYDSLDVLISNKAVNQQNKSILPQESSTTFSPYLELVGAYCAHSVPFIFYSSACLKLNVPVKSFWDVLDESVSLLFRLDYANGDAHQLNKGIGTQSIHFLSHLIDEELKLFVLKDAEEVQDLANVLSTIPIDNYFPQKVLKIFFHEPLKVNSLEKEVHSMQTKAVEAWIKIKGGIDETTLNNLLEEVAFTLLKSKPLEVSKTVSEVTSILDFAEVDILKQKLEIKNVESGERPLSNRLLQPNGLTATVDVNKILRCFSKNSQTRTPKKVRAENPPSYLSTRLKPTTNLVTAQTTEWPQCTKLKYHGINYNLTGDDEKDEKKLNDYQSKLVPADIEMSTWCNPWSFHSSSAYQLTNLPRPTEARTPRKNVSKDHNILPRKSPRLLAKVEPRTRRTPKKNATPAISAKDNFKQQLKAVIIKVLSEHKISTKDPLFRTCANKLSVICMALLKDSKSSATSRQMYQVAKSHAKQVVQFMKQ